MPLFDYRCEKCEHVYEVLIRKDTDEKQATCPECGSDQKKKLVPRSFAFNFGDPVGTDRWRSSHDYRFHHNLPNVKAQREAAEKASRVGPTPYNHIDDTTNSDTFGEVK